MIHPSNLAVDYIWGKFIWVWFSNKSLELIENIGKIQSKLSHRPFNPESSEHRKFLAQLEEDIASVSKKYPHISF
jgi:hypothetical protein